jgi:selT/selW/selH-like putative selenoprotein
VLSKWAPLFKDLQLIPGSGGAFEVVLDGDLIFSKKQLKRHANPGEVVGLVEQRLGPAVMEEDG